MAVKQSNTDDEESVNGGNTDSTTTSIVNGNTPGSSGSDKNANKNCLVSGEVCGIIDSMHKPGCSGGDSNLSPAKSNVTADNVVLDSGLSKMQSRDIQRILFIIEIVQQQQIISPQDMLKIYQQLIIELSHVQVPRQSEELKRFKDDIVKVGDFFGKTSEKCVYIFYLRTVCQLITQNGKEPPSCAVAIIFQLFNQEIVYEAVRSILDHKIHDQSIRRTAKLLCEWLRMCNFCQNLNLWIMAILDGLQKQRRFALHDDIALENIELLFSSMILPVLRPKVAPIVFQMLATIKHSPLVFHKILPKFPRILTFLKQQSNSHDDFAEDTKKILQELVDLTSALMVRFYEYSDLYDSVEMSLKNFRPSLNNQHCYGVEAVHKNNAKVGLVNLGNTCYMNSVLQALAMTREFCKGILLSKNKSPLLLKMQQQIALMLYSYRQDLTPSRILNATRPPGFSPGLQQDSSEFLGYLLETLHEQETNDNKEHNVRSLEEYSKPMVKIGKQNEVGAESSTSTETTANENVYTSNLIKSLISTISNTCTNGGFTEQTIHKKHTSIVASSNCAAQSTIEKTFTGKLATIYKCLSCGWKSQNFDSFHDLQLSFPEVKNEYASNYSVQDLIDYYCSSEKLFGDNQYFCERCKKLSDAERYINIIKAPKNLILTLKHFKYDQKCHMRAKLMHKVFHDEKVSIKVCSMSTLDEISCVYYNLYAGVVHSGFSMDSGHYYTYAADASNKWYKFNDSVVTLSKPEELHNLSPPNTPYILFYQMGARSNEVVQSSGSIKVIKMDVPSPLTLDELPRELRDYVIRDNISFSEELKARRSKNIKFSTQAIINTNDGESGYDDEDDQPPSTGGCGGNTMNLNVNRFVY